MIFPYKKVSASTYGPIISVALRAPARWVPFNAFVDSGADYSVFHSDVAILLGFDLTAGRKKIVTVGDGDEMTTWLHDVRVRFAGYVFVAVIAFSSGLGAGFNLIGRKTFFEKFQVCFNDRDRFLRATSLTGKKVNPLGF